MLQSPPAAGSLTRERIETPEAAVDRLEELYAAATTALRRAVDRFLENGHPPTPEEREAFRYPELSLTYLPEGVPGTNRRAFAKFSAPGVYATTVTQPGRLPPLPAGAAASADAEYGAVIEVGVSDQEIPYPYVLERADELAGGGVTAAELARHFPTPQLSAVGDEIADGAVGASARASRARWRCSTPCASTTRCAASCTTRAATGATCSPGSCSPTTTATSTSSCAGAASSCRPATALRRARPAGRRRASTREHRRRRGRRAGRRLRLAPLPDAGLSPDRAGRARA